MAMYDVYSHPELRRYRTSICSKATIFMIFMYIFTFVVPILIIYRSNGLWITTSTVMEQANVKFKHQILSEFVIQKSTSPNPSILTWSTITQFNSIFQSTLRIPLVKSREEDSNRDGKYDKLILDLQLPLASDEDLHRFTILLFFEYKLSKLSLITMESMASISDDSALTGAAYTSIGELKLNQKTPIRHKGVDTRYNTAIIDTTSILPQDYDLVNIYRNYASRNLSTTYINHNSLWTIGKPLNGMFNVRLEISYPGEIITYYTGFWQMFKYGLVQYITILIIFAFLCERIKLFVFSQQLVNTVTIKPFKSN